MGTILIVVTMLVLAGYFLKLRIYHDLSADPDMLKPPNERVDQLWNFIVIDEGSDSRIRKWLSPGISTRLIVDQEHMTQFAPQILDLVGKFSDRSPIHVDVCIDAPGSSFAPEGKCASDHFDSYFVVTNGQWDDAQWSAAFKNVPTWASDRFQKLMRRIDENAASGKGTCQFILRPDNEQGYDVTGSIAVADFSDKKIIGACFINLFLGSLGVSPFDGREQISPSAEAKSYSEFLLKDTPNGGLYLTKALYLTDLRPGMTESEATPILKRFLSRSP